MEQVNRLKKVFALNGFTYKEIKRSRKKALYGQYNDAGMCVAHELVIVTALPAAKVFKKHYPEREHYPSNEEMGKLGWSITNDQDKAIKMFDNFVKFQKR